MFGWAETGAIKEFRRKRDEAMFREMDAEAKRMETARAEAAERVRWETQAALDLRVLQKLRLRGLGALDRPTCPAPPAETPPPAPFAGATWIQGRYDWNGLAWTSFESGTTQTLFGIWGSGSDDVWITGRGGTILHWDGSAWIRTLTSGLQ